MQLRRGNQPKKNTNIPEYEIKTYGSNAGINRSPKITNTNSRYTKQGSIRRDYPNDSSLGEMAYIEPGGDIPLSRPQKKSGHNQNYAIRSPLKNSGNKENSNLNTNERIDISSQNNYSHYNYNPVPPLSNYDNRRDRLSRSPKTINIGETAQEAEYNIKTLKGMSSKNMPQPEKDNPVIERTYNMISNEAGNIFLDQPIHQTSFVNQQEIIEGRGSFESKDFENRDFPVREAQYTMNPRDYNGILGKMSPRANIDGDSDSNSEKNENNNIQIKDLRSQLEKRQNVQLRNDDGMIEGTKPIQNELEKIEDMVKMQEKNKDNITEEEVKKLVKMYVKSYDPKKDGEGRLISNKQTVVPSIKEDLFNDRYKVLQKMNKLSNILLSKKKSQNVYEVSTLNRSFGDGRSFDKTTLNNTTLGKKGTYRGKHNKFLFVSLAMLSAKENGETRTILRRMRLDKGGVVDLAQENAKKKNKFKIKNFKGTKRGQNMINPKYKEKAAKIVQGWWREQKAKYKNILNQIVKIQSVWRGKFTRKYVYDIIYLSYLHQRFFDIMEKTLVNHTRPMVWDELFSRAKIAKSTMKKLLERNDTKYTLLRIKPYFHKWKIIANFLKNRIIKSKTLVIKKGNEEQKRIILKKYLDRWNLKANLAKYIGKTKKAEEKRQKFLGAYEMLNGLKTHTQKVSLKQVEVPMKKYLQDILKKKLMKKIVNNSTSKLIIMKMKNALHKWKEAVHKAKYSDLKANIFIQNITHVDSRMDRIKLKYYLDKWRRHVPSGKRVLDIQEGANLLQKFTLRNALIDPLKALAVKCEKKDEHNKVATLFVIKRRKIRESLRTCINRWQQKTIKIDNKTKRNNIYNTLLKNLLKNIEKRILYKRFNQWRQRPKIDINNEMSKVRDFTNILSNIFKNNVRPEKYDFLDKLETTRANRAILKSTKKIYKNYKKKSRRILRHFFYKWRSQTKNSEITELQNQLLKFLFISKESRLNRLNMAKYMTRWRLFVSDKKHYDNMEKLKRVYKAGDILGNLKNRRQRDFIIRLYRKMGKDYRPLILDKLTQKLEKPRSTLRECLERWRRINEKEKALETITSMKVKFIHQGTKRINDRTKRDDLMKAFFRWRILCRKPDEYYPKITRGFDILTKYSKRKLCEEPFDLISISRNFERPLKKILKNYQNQENRLLNGKLRNLFGRWRKKIGDKNIKNLKTNLIYKTKNNLENNQRIKTLAKYFTRWKLYRRKGLDVNFSKGINILTNLYRKPFYNDVVDAYSKKVEQISKLKGANNLVKATKRYSKILLRSAFIKMYKGAISIDPNRMKKIKTRLRRIIKHNEEEPRAKAFHRWANQVKLMQFRDKDMEKARLMIGNTLRNNDRMNLNYAMSRWKKKIQQIREQYLKSLLVKQIKTSQIVKEQITNESRLRSALLKWRSKLVPIDYLDRLKRIRKGCKLFKKGLKKRDEREIFDNINELAKYNRKNNLLKKIINEINPEIAKYHMKRCIDIWKSKLPDTQRMKNKIHLLFEDYLYSDKVHEGLFDKSKNDIINLFKDYSDKKKEAANKISKFVKSINLIKRYKEKMLALLKINKILNNKQKALKEIKRIQFIRYYRQTQKVKNDENARIIQKFIKEKLRKYFDKRDLVKKGIDAFNLFIKRKILNNLKDKAKDTYTKTVIKKTIIRQENANNESLRNAFNKWRNLLPELKKNEAADKIINLFRKNKAKNIKNNLKMRIEKLITIYINYEDKNKKILYSHFHDWLHRALVIKNNENARIIQRFCRMKMDQHNEKLAKEKLQKFFKDDIKHKLAHIMERSSRIIGGKGEVVYKTLQDILYRTPYEKFIEKMKFLGKINTLRKVQPKIHEKIKEYYLPLYLKKWKENTYDVTIRQTKILQKFLRDQYAKKMERDRLRREELLIEIVKRKQKNNLYKLQLPFNIWSKKTKLAKMNESATKIQNMFRNYLAKEKAKDLSCKSKWDNIIKKLLYRNMVDGLKDAGFHKNLKINQKKILKIIFEKKSFDDEQSSLKRYMDKWRRYNIYYKKNVNKIQNAFRIYLANKEKNRLKRIDEILKKTIIKHDKTTTDTLRSKLRKWNNKAQLIKYNENSRIIQRFIRPKLARLLFEKFQKFFYDNGKKKAINLLVLAGKMNKLLHAINRPTLQRFRNNLDKISTHHHINDNLRNIVTKKNGKDNIEKLTRYFSKWKTSVATIKKNENDSASKIQRAFLSSIARGKKKRLKRIKEILVKLTIQKYNISNNKLYIYFTRWLSNARIMAINENARIIQEFCRGILKKCKDEKDSKDKMKRIKGLAKLLNIKFGKRFVYDKIRSEINRNIFKKFNDDLKKHRLDTLKECFDKIKKTAFDNKLKSALNIPDSLKTRILKKIIIIWKENADKIARNHGADKIIKNWRIYNLKKKKENRDQILKDIFIKLYNKDSDMKNKYFNRWIDLKNKLNNEIAKKRVAIYIANRYKISNARKNWQKLSKNLILKNRNNDLFEVIKRTKKYIYLNKFKNPFINIARKKFITKIIDDKRKENVLDKLNNIIPKRENNNKEIILRKYFLKWIEKTNKINERENKMKNALDALNKKIIKSDVEKINSVFLIKKLTHDIPYIRSKLFFNKLKKNSDNKTKYENLSKDLQNADDNIKNQNKQKLLNKILKLYAYKKIEGMVNACNDYDENIIKPKYGKEFLQKLFLNMTNRSQYNYENRIDIQKKSIKK